MPIWEQEAANAAGGIVGAGLGLALQGANDRRQLKQQGKLQALEIEGQKQMGIFNRQQQMQLWNDTNYSAQMEQLKKAGLNPGLMYGMGGGSGGTTQANTGNVTGGQAPQGGGEIMGMAMMQAQIRNINADTQQKEATTNKTGFEAKIAEIQSRVDAYGEVNNKEPIKDGAPLIYTDRKDGVKEEYNIRTDRWEIAVTEADRVAAAKTAARDKRATDREMKRGDKLNGGDGKLKGIEGPGSGVSTSDKE